jgi:hypothetical protein
MIFVDYPQLWISLGINGLVFRSGLSFASLRQSGGRCHSKRPSVGNHGEPYTHQTRDADWLAVEFTQSSFLCN